MAFGYGKKWWKRASGLSAAQGRASRRLGVRLSGRRRGCARRMFAILLALAAVSTASVFVACGGSRKPAPQAAQAPPPPPKTDKERIQRTWVDTSGQWVWEFTEDDVTVWRRGADEAEAHPYALWPDPAWHIDVRDTPRCGIYRFDGDDRLTLAFGQFAAGRPKTFDPAEGVELVTLRPLAEAEAEWEAQARQAADHPPQAERELPAAGTEGNAPSGDKPSVNKPPSAPVGGFTPVPPVHASRGPKEVHVSGYTTKDGKHVGPYTRSAPGTGGGRRR